MKNIYFNRLRKNKGKEAINNNKNFFPLKQYVHNGNNLNAFGPNKKGVNKSEYINNINHSNKLLKSYNQPSMNYLKYQIRDKSKCNNHSLYDSNKRQIINIDNNNDYIRFESNNIEKEKVTNNNSIYNSSSNKNNKRNYSYQKNYFNSNITNINYNINIQNFTNKKSISTNNSINKTNYNSNIINNKYINQIKNDLIKNRNNLSNFKSNYNFTEISYTNKNKTPKMIKNKRRELIKRNLTENNYLKEKSKEVNRSSSINPQKYNLKKENNINTNKANTRFNDIKAFKYNLNAPIKLNIEDINKEKLSRLKRIIEQGSTNLNYYKMEISKGENTNKTPNKNNYNKRDKSQYIFKKKKINMIKKEENAKNQKEFNTNKKPNLILNSQLKKTKNQRIKYNEINNNNNNDDTISLSYSKEQNNINEKNIFLHSIEQFNIYYNKFNKSLIINDKNNKNKILKNESDDDDYQLTTEIILLKRGLAKKSELSNELRKKIREMRMQRIYMLNIPGNNKVYKKKNSNYKITKI